MWVWAPVEGLLYVVHGWDGPLTRTGGFFTKAALVTFLALWRYRLGIIPVIAASALAGLLYSLLA